MAASRLGGVVTDVMRHQCRLAKDVPFAVDAIGAGGWMPFTTAFAVNQRLLLFTVQAGRQRLTALTGQSAPSNLGSGDCPQRLTVGIGNGPRSCRPAATPRRAWRLLLHRPYRGDQALHCRARCISSVVLFTDPRKASIATLPVPPAAARCSQLLQPHAHA